jgi:hypothetical protein
MFVLGVVQVCREPNSGSTQAIMSEMDSTPKNAAGTFDALNTDDLATPAATSTHSAASSASKVGATATIATKPSAKPLVYVLHPRHRLNYRF